MYKLIQMTADDAPQSVLRLTDHASIPFDPANRDYTEYLEWLSQGNEPLPPDEPTLS
jgi:hypothetical protein